MSKKPFDKFINKKSNAAKKEEFRQERRKAKQAARERGEEYRSAKPTQRKQTENYQVTRNLQAGKKSTEGAEGADLRGKQTPLPGAKRGDKAMSRSFDKTSSSKGTGRSVTARGSKPARGADAPVAPAKPALQRQGSATEMPLNKFIAHSGVCARREAAELVKAGHVTVNGDKVFEPAYRVSEKDKVSVKGKSIHLQKDLVYILLNKPKDYITTAKDPEGRKTVFDLIKDATADRVYPVGRLDRNTTGVLLLTNDGELAQKLTHPSFNIKKIYEVKLDKPIVKKDMEQLVNGINLEDGFIKADSVAYADQKDKSVVGIEIHSGRNRIVRRMFEHLGYDVKGLDRVMFANLTKKNVDRGRYRYLNEKEVRLLKFLNQSFLKKGRADIEEN